MRIPAGSAFIVVGALAGYLTGVQSLGRAGQVAISGNAHWTQSRANPKDPYLIYATGHFMQEGILPPPKSAQVFTRSVDEDGNALRSACTYSVSGPEPQARWWSLNAGAAGSAETRASITGGDAIISGDGQLLVTLSPQPQPGNWLEAPNVGSMRVSLVLNEPYPAVKNAKPAALPTIKKLGCE